MNRTFGIIGLGKMGGNLALQALEKGWKVVGYSLSSPPKEMSDKGLQFTNSLEEFKDALSPPRKIFCYIPAGKAIDDLIGKLENFLVDGDVLVDGGNSYWGDSMRRYERLKALKIGFVDLGTSGGVSGARSGACFMAGGEPQVVEGLEELLKNLAVEGGYMYAGPPGSGHFVKLVHNGIEFGMLEAIGEGMELLSKWPQARIDLAAVLQCWSHGSVIRSWLIELLRDFFIGGGGNLKEVPPFIEDTGEVNWLVSDALHMETSIPVIAQSVMQLFASREKEKECARTISVIRHGFGGHPYGPFAALEKERRTGRLSDAFILGAQNSMHSPKEVGQAQGVENK
jgi:6-phosphogluconate dehydrogenase